MRRSSLTKRVREGLAIGALILVIAALVGFAGAPRVLALSAPTPAPSSSSTIQGWLHRETTRLTVATPGVLPDAGGQPAAGGQPTGGVRASGSPRAGMSPAEVDAGGSDDLSLLLWIAIAVVVLLVTAVMVRRVFAGL